MTQNNDINALLQEFEDVEKQMQDPDNLNNAAKAKKLNIRYSFLKKVKDLHAEIHNLKNDIAAAEDLSKDDKSFVAEIDNLTDKLKDKENLLAEILIPKDENNQRDAIIEIKGGAGGAESALFASDLYRMYCQYAAKQGWKIENLDISPSELGGYKNIQFSIKSSDINNPVYAKLRYEGGVHRVQRVPETESQGRVHTSTTGVLVFPETDDPDEIEINPNDLKIDVYRSSGPGGQSVNTTDSAVRITHIPSGIVVAMQNEKSQIQNKAAAMRVLQSRLLAKQIEEQEAAAAESRKSQVKSFDRSERIRTYNFPENRIADHRTGYKAYNLDAVINGQLDEIIDSCIKTLGSHL